MRQAPSQLTELTRSTVESMGFELVGVQLLQNTWQGKTLKVYIDQQQGINVDDCARVSRQLSAVLDVENPIRGAYVLEVSSPGLDRLLFEPEQFMCYIGYKLTLRLNKARNGRRRYLGKLLTVGKDEIEIEDEEKIRHSLAFSEIDTARLVPEF